MFTSNLLLFLVYVQILTKAMLVMTQGFASEFIGVSWSTSVRQWKACVSHDGEIHYLGSFGDDQEAALAFDAAARRLRAKGKAHGGRSGSNWLRVNFPNTAEKAFAKGTGMPPQKKRNRPMGPGTV